MREFTRVLSTGEFVLGYTSVHEEPDRLYLVGWKFNFDLLPPKLLFEIILYLQEQNIAASILAIREVKLKGDIILLVKESFIDSKY